LNSVQKQMIAQGGRSDEILNLTCQGRATEAITVWQAKADNGSTDALSSALIALCYYRLGQSKAARTVLKSAPSGGTYSNCLIILRIIILRNLRRRTRALRRVFDLRGLTARGWFAYSLWAMQPDQPADATLKGRRFLRDIGGPVRPRGARIADATGSIQLSQVVSVRDHVTGNGGQLVFDGPAEPIRFADIRDWRTGTSGTDSTIQGYTPYVAALENMTVSTLSNLVFTSTGTAVSDSYADARYGKFVDPRGENLVAGRCPGGLLSLRLPVTRKIGRAIHLCGLASGHFGHWFSEFLPRLRHFERLADFDQIPILVNSRMPASHFEFLGMLCKNPLIRLEPEDCVEVGELLVAPTITFYPFDLVPGHAVPETAQAAWSAPAFAYLRGRVLAAFPKHHGPKRAIYLSRRNSAWGRVVNEPEVEAALIAIGVETVLLEKMSFLEQVACMRSASVIVSPTGSALNSVVFADPDTTILVLSQGATHNWGGWAGPLRELGFDPKFHFVADADRMSKHVGLRVDTKELCRAVRTLTIERTVA
jgi:hypothetical protein